MRRSLIVVGIILLVAGLGQAAMAAAPSAAPAKPAAPVSAAATARPASASPAAKAAPAEAASQRLVVTVQLPAKGEGGAARPMGRGAGGHGAGCFQSQTGELLGVTIARPHGCIIGNVLPEGPAGKAGIKPGDSIIAFDGKEVTCPRTLVMGLGQRPGPREVKLTIVRAGGAESAGATKAGATAAGAASADKEKSKPRAAAKKAKARRHNRHKK